MKKIHLSLGTLSVVILAAASMVISPLHANAGRTMPNWLEGEVIYQTGSVSPNTQSCVLEARTIESVSGRVYDASAPDTTQQVCIYRSNGYEYASYRRAYYIYPSMHSFGTIYEDGIAIAKTGNSVMTPTKIYNGDISTATYMGDSTMLINQSRVCVAECLYTITVYKDAARHFIKDTDGYIILDGNPDFTYTNSEGTLITTLGGSVSGNRHWFVFAVPNAGFMRLNLETFDIRRVSDRFDYSIGKYPRPLPGTAINDSGDYMVSGGRNMPTDVVHITDECGVDATVPVPDVLYQSIGDLNCPHRDITGVVDLNAEPGSIGQIEFKEAFMANNGFYFSYRDREKWSTIYAPNYLQSGQLYYLALGDSYAAGEGDVTLDGADHYLLGTNVYGNYYNGTPRETCHISTRSYPMRIASAMQLTRGVDMNTIACSGAIVSDIIAAGQKSNGYMDANYLGQSTQVLSRAAPRLTGITNATQLQDQARASYIPGRVQQIELIKKAQPKNATVMIGGNDIDFAGVMAACAKNALPSADETCDYAQGDGLVGEATKIRDLYPVLVDFFKTLKEVSPKTTIYALGYPQFMDDQNKSCTEMLSLYSVPERKAIHNFIAYANAVIRNAALDGGAKYIDISDALAGNELCASGTNMTGITDMLATMIYTEYMKSLTMADSHIAKYLNILPVGTLHKVALQIYLAERAIALTTEYLYSPATAFANTAQQLAHPNALGHEAMYNKISQGLGVDLLDSTACNVRVACPAATALGQPNISSYIPGLAIREDTVYKTGNGKVIVTHTAPTGQEIIGSLVKSAANQFIRIAKDIIENIDVQKPVIVEIHSQPIVLGVMTQTAEGYELRTALDQDIKVGQHVLHIKGTLVDGQKFDIDAPVFVEGPQGDIDDDGVGDNIDTCAFGVAEGIDMDHDGIDDTCDFIQNSTSNGSKVSIRLEKTTPFFAQSTDDGSTKTNRVLKDVLSEGKNTLNMNDELAKRTEGLDAKPAVPAFVYLMVLGLGAIVGLAYLLKKSK